MINTTIKGTTLRVDQQSIDVKIKKHEACSGCQLKSACNIHSSKTQIITIKTTNATKYQVGQEVSLFVSSSCGVWAAFYAYVLPLIIMIITLLASYYFSKSDNVAGLCGIGVVGLYYIVIYALRNTLFKKIKINII